MATAAPIRYNQLEQESHRLSGPARHSDRALLFGLNRAQEVLVKEPVLVSRKPHHD